MACLSLKRLRENNESTNNQTKVKRRRRHAFGILDSTTNVANNKLTNDNIDCETEAKTSQFTESIICKISPSKLEQNIRAEIQRLNKMKQLTRSYSNESMHDYDSPMTLDPSNSLMRSSPDRPLFNFKQVQLICRRMMEDQENKIREEYDAVLTAKLAEQYDSFVKFTFDQIQLRLVDTPSYLS